MNARGVSKCVKRINRRKSSRESPAAVIGNGTNPSTSFSINERIFRRSILPVAIANKWISDESGGGPNLEFDILQGQTDFGESNSWTFDEDTVFVARLNIAVYDGQANLTVEYAGGETATMVYNTLGGVYMVQVAVSPAGIAIESNIQEGETVQMTNPRNANFIHRLYSTDNMLDITYYYYYLNYTRALQRAVNAPLRSQIQYSM